MSVRRPASSECTPSPAAPHPNPGHLAHVLAMDRDETLRRLDRMAAQFDELVDASVSSNADDEHDPEGPTMAFERSQLDALIRQARQHLEEVDAAADRITDGTYGRCQTCGRPIPVERLEARRVARTCIGCAPVRPADPARSHIRAHGRDGTVPSA